VCDNVCVCVGVCVCVCALVCVCVCARARTCPCPCLCLCLCLCIVCRQKVDVGMEQQQQGGKEGSAIRARYHNACKTSIKCPKHPIAHRATLKWIHTIIPTHEADAHTHCTPTHSTQRNEHSQPPRCNHPQGRVAHSNIQVRVCLTAGSRSRGSSKRHSHSSRTPGQAERKTRPDHLTNRVKHGQPSHHTLVVPLCLTTARITSEKAQRKTQQSIVSLGCPAGTLVRL
jgi:hypothetical protein